MRRAKWLAVIGAAMVTVLCLAGCPKKQTPAATTGRGVSQSLTGTGDTSGMPPEARKAMEAAKRKAQSGPPARR